MSNLLKTLFDTRQQVLQFMNKNEVYVERWTKAKNELFFVTRCFSLIGNYIPIDKNDTRLVLIIQNIEINFFFIDKILFDFRQIEITSDENYAKIFLTLLKIAATKSVSSELRNECSFFALINYYGNGENERNTQLK